MTRAPACVAVASVMCPQPERNHGSHESVPAFASGFGAVTSRRSEDRPVRTPAARQSAPARRRPARQRPAIFLLVLFAVLFPASIQAQTEPGWEVEGLNQVMPGAPEGGVTYDFASGTATGTNIFVKYGTATLMADSATVNQQTGEVVADGHVRIEMGDMTWIGEHIRYNF